ncbi:hypothetical protein MPLB_1760051 [Mesorhizobium sp. ORS 3324]|nr:hypothetical protein MPLB_1760051 [Mesorhizobium sp. ORS 3324]
MNWQIFAATAEHPNRSDTRSDRVPKPVSYSRNLADTRLAEPRG